MSTLRARVHRRTDKITPIADHTACVAVRSANKTVISDGNKTKMLRPRPRPRPIKQQQDYITKKTLLLQNACLLSKITLCKKTSKNDIMTSYVWHCFCTYCTKKIQVFITFQHYHVTQRLSGTTVF